MATPVHNSRSLYRVTQALAILAAIVVACAAAALTGTATARAANAGFPYDITQAPSNPVPAGTAQTTTFSCPTTFDDATLTGAEYGVGSPSSGLSDVTLVSSGTDSKTYTFQYASDSSATLWLICDYPRPVSAQTVDVSYTIESTPGTPSNLVATPGDGAVSVSWSAPSSDGNRTISGYTLRYRTSSSGAWATTTTTATATTVTGLTNGTAYDFQVAATNAVGTSAYTPTTTATPRTVPGSPTITTVVAAERSATITWTAPDSDGGTDITGYTVQTSLDGQTWTDAVSTTPSDTTPLSATIDDLTDGVAVQFRVIAANAAGQSTPSVTVSATPRTTPGPPTWVTVTPDDVSAHLEWAAPTDNGGAPITGYEIQESNDDTTWDVVTADTTDTALTVTGLTNGTAKSFRVRAINAAGPGDWSSVVITTPRTITSAPLNVNATPGATNVTLTWDTPNSDGGSAVTGYEVEQRAAGTAEWEDPQQVNDTVTTVTGLTNGTAYDFRVRAINSAGDSAWSTTVTATPFAFHIEAVLVDGRILENATVEPGSVVLISASKLPDGATVTVEAHSTATVLATLTVDSDGKVTARLVLPKDLPAGGHTVTATLTNTGADPVTQSIPFTVHAAATAPDKTTSTPSARTGTGHDADVLAYTGSGELIWVGGGAAAIALALGTLLLIRKRSRERAELRIPR